MILADTSIWISHLRRGFPRMRTLLENADVAVHPFIMGELACGTMKARTRIRSLLREMPFAPVLSHGEVMHFIEVNHLPGVGISYVDAHLLASARLARFALWTSDESLKQAARRLGLRHD